MNYLLIYKNLIRTRRFLQKERLEKKKEIYLEKHHITPICLKELNNDNLIYLTFREHFVAHRLLAKIFEDTKYVRELKFAISMMAVKNGKQKRILNSRQYYISRKENIEAKKLYWKDEEKKKEASKIQKEIWKNPVLVEKQKMIMDNILNNSEKSKWYSDRVSEGVKKSYLVPGLLERKSDIMKNVWQGEMRKKICKILYLVENPDGQVWEVKDGITKFCREMRERGIIIYSQNLCKLANGKLKYYKGWKCKKI